VLSELARQNPTPKFISSAHLLDEEVPVAVYWELNPKAVVEINHEI
jgi:hypothetical protein